MRNLYEDLRQSYKQKNLINIKKHVHLILNQLLETDFLEQNLKYHPLGFIYCRLHEFDNDENIRLHIWNKFSDIQISSMDIHNHFYDVNSYVFKGSITNTLYKINDNESITHFQYVGSYIDLDKRLLTKTAIGNKLIKISHQIIKSGELYRIPKQNIHSGSAIGNTITITYSENPGNPQPLIFGPINGEDQYLFESQKIPNNVVQYVKSQITST